MESDEDVTIYDVVDCEIILLRKVGDGGENFTANNMKQSSDPLLIDLTGDDDENDNENDYIGEDSSELAAKEVKMERDESKLQNVQEAFYATMTDSAVEVDKMKSSRGASTSTDGLPTNNSNKEKPGVTDLDKLDDYLEDMSATTLSTDTTKRGVALNDQPKSPKSVNRANIQGKATYVAAAMTLGNEYSDVISEGEETRNDAVQLKGGNEHEAVKYKGLRQEPNDADEKQEKKTNEEDYIEIMDTSDSEQEDEGGKKTSQNNASVPTVETAKDDTVIVDDDEDESSEDELEIIDKPDDDESSDDELEIIDEPDNEEASTVMSRASDEAKRERARKRQESRRTQATMYQVERKLLEARRRRAKKAMETRKKKAKSLPPNTLPNFTFYTAPRREQPQPLQKPMPERKEPHSSKGFNYMGDSAAFLEQERLLRASAVRVKAQEIAKRRIEISRGGLQFYTEPVKDLSTMPKDHFKWSNLYSRLGVPERSHFTVVKKNYRKLCLLYHPDKAGSNNKETQDRFQAIKEAYEKISESREV